MRYLPLVFLILIAARPLEDFPGSPQHSRFSENRSMSSGNRFSRHHGMPSTWHMRTRDGSSASDFGRSFRHFERAGFAGLSVERARLNSVDVGNGARVGVGMVQGRNPGFRLKLPF